MANSITFGAEAAREQHGEDPPRRAIFVKGQGLGPRFANLSLFFLLTRLALSLSPHPSQGCMALMGQRGPIYRLPQPAVQAAMQAWGVAAVPKLRQIAKQMKMLTAFACVGAGSGELCPNWSAMGYEAQRGWALWR